MGQKVVPDDHIAGLGGNGPRQRREVYLARVGAGGQAGQPCFELAMEARHALKGTLLGGRVAEVDETLRAEVKWRVQTHVPMQRRALVAVGGRFGWVEAGAVGGGPEVGRAPELGKCLLNARRAAVLA